MEKIEKITRKIERFCFSGTVQSSALRLACLKGHGDGLRKVGVQGLRASIMPHEY